MEKIIKYLTSTNFFISIITVLLSILIYFVLKNILSKLINKEKDNNHKKRITYVKLLNSIMKYAIIILTIFAILQINGVDVTSIFLSLGVAGVITGLALQDALKDIVMGFNIITDGYFSVGDVIEICNTKAKVLEIGLKVTKLQDINNDNLLVISNRTIDKSIIISNKNLKK